LQTGGNVKHAGDQFNWHLHISGRCNMAIAISLIFHLRAEMQNMTTIGSMARLVIENPYRGQ
jgi:hypothetical protein